MGEGAGEPNSESAQRPEPKLSVPRRRLIQRFTLIESNYQDLKESLRRHYPDEQSFVDDWTSAEFESQERIAALERFFERIVNALNQIVDDTERALREDGELPDLAPSKRGRELGRGGRFHRTSSFSPGPTRCGAADEAVHARQGVPSSAKSAPSPSRWRSQRLHLIRNGGE